MKYLVSLLFGLALGVAAALAALFYNPLTRASTDDAPAATLEFDYALDSRSVLLETHDNTVALPVVPIDSPLLWEGGLKGTILAALPLESKATPGAVATRLTIPSPETELLTAGVIAHDYWLVSVPAAGSFFVEATSNYWPLLRDTAVSVDLLRRDWSGPQHYAPTLGPDDGAAKVVGLTGRYAAESGQGADRLTLDRYDGSFAGLSGRLIIDLDTATADLR